MLSVDADLAQHILCIRDTEVFCNASKCLCQDVCTQKKAQRLLDNTVRALQIDGRAVPIHSNDSAKKDQWPQPFHRDAEK